MREIWRMFYLHKFGATRHLRWGSGGAGCSRRHRWSLCTDSDGRLFRQGTSFLHQGTSARWPLDAHQRVAQHFLCISELMDRLEREKAVSIFMSIVKSIGSLHIQEKAVLKENLRKILEHVYMYKDSSFMLSLSLSHTHTHKHTHTLAHSHTHTHFFLILLSFLNWSHDHLADKWYYADGLLYRLLTLLHSPWCNCHGWQSTFS